MYDNVVGVGGTAYAQTLLSLCDISPMRGIPSTPEQTKGLITTDLLGKGEMGKVRDASLGPRAEGRSGQWTKKSNGYRK